MAVITVDSDRSPADVFDYLVNLRNELEWNTGVESKEKITGGPIGVGTKYRAKWKHMGSGTCECTRYDRPHGWSYVVGGRVTVHMDISLTPRRDGTTLVTRYDARINGLLALIFPIVRLMTRRANKTNLLNAKQTRERKHLA